MDSTKTARPLRHQTSGGTSAARSTTVLLACGIVAGPLFVVTVLAQAFTRSGFDPKRHPLSSLSLGELGWIQITNFVVTGLLVLALAAGIRRVLHPGRAGTWGPLLIGVNGLSLIAGGVFLADPINGYPPGVPDQVTWHGIVHSTAPSLAGLAGLAAYAVFARRLAGTGQRVWAWLSLAFAPPVLALNIAAAIAADFRLMLAGLALGWAWTSLIAARLMAETRYPATIPSPSP